MREWKCSWILLGYVSAWNHELVKGLFWAVCPYFNFFFSSFFSPSQGGIAFVAIKGAFKVYFKQQQYLRQAHRKILNFPEQEEAWGGQMNYIHTSAGVVRREEMDVSDWWNRLEISITLIYKLLTPPTLFEADILRKHPDHHHTLFLNSSAFVYWRLIGLVDTDGSMFAVTHSH